MLEDARGVPDGASLATSVCVIGGGAAGITLARRLGARHDVVLLEAGDVTGDADTQELMDGENAGLPYFSLVGARLRFLGGATNHWGGVCRRMSAMDLERHPAVPGSGWPFGIEELERHYEAAEQLCGLPAPGRDPATVAERDERAPVLTDQVRLDTRVAEMVEVHDRSFAARYLDELRAARRVRVLLRANVVHLHTAPAGGPVSAVEVATLEGNRFTVTARVVVLAAGGIENARLLLASDQQRPDGLGNQHDLVGRYFLEHPRFVAARIVPTGGWLPTRLYEWHDVGSARIRGYVALPDERRRAEGLADVQLRLKPMVPPAWEENLDAAEVEAALRFRRALKGRRNTLDLARDLRVLAEDLSSWARTAIPGAPVPLPQPAVLGALLRGTAPERVVPQVFGDVLTHGYRRAGLRTPVEDVEVVGRFEPIPNPDSRVRLSRERDALGVRRVVLDWQLRRDDRENLVRTLELVGAELAAAGLGRMQLLVDSDDTTWPDDLEGGWHHIGTTRMSTSPRQGVVDPQCQVHDVPGLFVAGSSVFPTAGSGTPTLTLVALALRLADHLEEVLR